MKLLYTYVSRAKSPEHRSSVFGFCSRPQRYAWASQFSIRKSAT
jgi:hypothetical protein